MATTEDRRKLDATETWRESATRQTPERSGELFSTISGVENEPLYSPENVELDYERDLGWPGESPFTRGVYPSMYRGRLWTMRQFAGFGTAEETNERFRYLLEHGQTGLSTAFDMPTLMGYDSDHPRSLGEVGREGVAIDSLADMETLFAGIPLGEVSTSMTINAPGGDAARVLRLRRRGAGRARATQLRGTVQTDILKEYIAQKEWIFPPAAVDAARRGHDRVVLARAAAHAPGLDLRLPHPRGRLDRGAGARVHARRRLRATSRRASSAGSTSTSSRRGSPSSSTRTSTSSRRSRSTAQRAGSGRRRCARSTARRTRARG